MPGDDAAMDVSAMPDSANMQAKSDSRAETGPDQSRATFHAHGGSSGTADMLLDDEVSQVNNARDQQPRTAIDWAKSGQGVFDMVGTGLVCQSVAACTREPVSAKSNRGKRLDLPRANVAGTKNVN